MIALVIGDVVGRPGRRAVSECLPALVAEFSVDIVIANGENAAGGAGITKETAQPLFEAGVDVITTGNHVWSHRDSYPYLDEEPRVLRPANFPEGAPGRGSNVFESGAGIKIGVINLQGRTFMQPIDDPFRVGLSHVIEIGDKCDVVVVDLHAEATSEKMAFAYYVDGRAACVYGTHTHVQTADERVLPGGTAYITDIGMTGPSESIIGMQPEAIIRRFTTGLPSKFDVAKGPVMLCGVVLDVDESSGKARAITRIRRDVR